MEPRNHEWAGLQCLDLPAQDSEYGSLNLAPPLLWTHVVCQGLYNTVDDLNVVGGSVISVQFHRV